MGHLDLRLTKPDSRWISLSFDVVAHAGWPIAVSKPFLRCSKLKYAAHEPSDDTMSAPTGFSGVHSLPNSLHCAGFKTPFRTSPHCAAFGSVTRMPGM